MTTPEAEGRSAFSLIDEPWIPALLSSGRVEELSLREVFARAEEVRDLVGEVSTQTFAITRLLLAIVHRALGEQFSSGAHWDALWQRGIPLTRVHDYLDRHRDRFDLLHPTTPFYQVADLHTATHEVKDVTPLLFDVPSNNRLFSARAGAALERIGYAEAARWLVHAQAYDPSGIKSGLVGDDRAKGGKGYPIGTGWAGAIGGVLIEGRSLAQTLVLNFVPGPEESFASDLPPWEREADTAAARADEHPQGPVDLFTWQSRRIRLVHDGSGVAGVVLGNGDRITPQNRYLIERHTAWRFSKPQTDKGKAGPVYMPREHRPGVAFWRGISGLIAERSGGGSASGPASSRPPGVVEWLTERQREGALPADERVAPRAFGVVYGSNQSVVSEIIDDRFSLPLAALSEQGERDLASAARRAVSFADDLVRELSRLAGNLAVAAGAGRESVAGPRERASEEGYAALDRPFRRWLAGLDPEQDAEQQFDAWKRAASSAIQDLADEQVRRAGPAAWIGRAADLGGREDVMRTSYAELIFRKGVRRAKGAIAEPGNGTASTESGEAK